MHTWYRRVATWASVAEAMVRPATIASAASEMSKEYEPTVTLPRCPVVYDTYAKIPPNLYKKIYLR